MLITIEQFKKSVVCTDFIAATWHPVIEQAMKRWEINNPLRKAGFMAQMSMECYRFTRFVESLNYSVQGLADTWPSRFAVDPKARPRVPNAIARKLGRAHSKAADQKAIANFVYGSRGGNKPGTDDGWNYRGRGPKQITFYDNYRECGMALGLDLLKSPDLLLVPAHGAQAAGWYWYSHGCNELMDTGDFRATTKAINGGYIGHEDGNTVGLDDRVEYFEHNKPIFGVV